MKKLEREPNKTRILSACVDAKSQIYPREGPGLHSLRLPIHRHVSFIKFLSPSAMCNLNAFLIELSCHLSNAHVVRIPFTVFFFLRALIIIVHRKLPERPTNGKSIW